MARSGAECTAATFDLLTVAFGVADGIVPQHEHAHFRRFVWCSGPYRVHIVFTATVGENDLPAGANRHGHDGERNRDAEAGAGSLACATWRRRPTSSRVPREGRSRTRLRLDHVRIKPLQLFARVFCFACFASAAFRPPGTALNLVEPAIAMAALTASVRPTWPQVDFKTAPAPPHDLSRPTSFLRSLPHCDLAKANCSI